MRKTFTTIAAAKTADSLKLMSPMEKPSSQGIFYIKFEADIQNPKNLVITYQLVNGGATSLKSTSPFKMYVGDFEEEGRITQRGIDISWQKLLQHMLQSSTGSIDSFIRTFFLRKNFQYLWSEVFFPFFEAPMAEKLHFKRFLKYNVEAMEVYLLDLNLPKAASFFLAAATILDELDGTSAASLLELAQKSEDALLIEVAGVLSDGFQAAGIEPKSLDTFNAALDKLDEQDEEIQKEREDRIDLEISGVIEALGENELGEKIKGLAKDIPGNARALKAALLMAWALVKDGEAFLQCEYAILGLDNFIKPEDMLSKDGEEIQKEKEDIKEKKEASVRIASIDEGIKNFLTAILPDSFDEVTLQLALDVETLRAFEQTLHEKGGVTTEELKALEGQQNIATIKLKLDKAQVLHYLQEDGIVIGEGVEVFYGPYEMGHHLPGTVLPLKVVKGKVDGSGTN